MRSFDYLPSGVWSSETVMRVWVPKDLDARWKECDEDWLRTSMNVADQ
jgi:hypothetical protein